MLSFDPILGSFNSDDVFSEIRHSALHHRNASGQSRYPDHSANARKHDKTHTRNQNTSRYRQDLVASDGSALRGIFDSTCCLSRVIRDEHYLALS